MTEEEARAIMKANGWNYHARPRGTQGRKYLYAERMRQYKRQEIYICPLSRLGEFTEAELVVKLAPEQEPTKETSSENHEPQVRDTSGPPTNTDEL